MVSTEVYAETSLRPPKGRAGQVGGGVGWNGNWHILGIATLWRLRQEDKGKFQARL